MRLPIRWIAATAGALAVLLGTASTSQAFFCCKKCGSSTSTTYYEPVAPTACSPCAPPAVVPVTVTTTRYGLFGLRTQTTVNYGAPVPVAAPSVSNYPPGVLLPAPPPTYYLPRP
jgi:recombinational DNA repair protein (RecF pathway)